MMSLKNLLNKFRIIRIGVKIIIFLSVLNFILFVFSEVFKKTSIKPDGFLYLSISLFVVLLYSNKDWFIKLWKENIYFKLKSENKILFQEEKKKFYVKHFRMYMSLGGFIPFKDYPEFARAAIKAGEDYTIFYEIASLHEPGRNELEHILNKYEYFLLSKKYAAQIIVQDIANKILIGELNPIDGAIEIEKIDKRFELGTNLFVFAYVVKDHKAKLMNKELAEKYIIGLAKLVIMPGFKVEEKNSPNNFENLN